MRKTKFLTFIFLTCIVLFCFCSCTNTEDSTKIVKLNKENVTVSVFEIVTLTTTTENITENIVWSSSDETVATVTNGIVTANKAGNVIVTASAEGVYASAKVTFTEIDSSKLTIVNEYVTLEIAEGESERLFSNVLFNEKFVDGGMFNYVTQNTSIAEISKDGTLSALSAGETTVTINGSIKGYTLAPVTFNVKVIENINLVTNLENDRITLYLSNGINNDYITEYTISPTVTVAGEIVNNATFDYKNNNETVIDFSNGVIVARAVGATAVDISYTSKKGTIVKKTVSVVVIKPRTEILKDSEILMGIKTANDLSVFGIRDEIKSFMVNGKKTTINVSGNSFTFNDDLTDGLSANIVIETDNEIFTFTADVYDYVVGSKEDFRAFGKNILIDSGTSVALTANINYEGGNFFTDSGFNDSCFYSGLFDGRGYTVYNIKGNNGIFYGFKNATVKNVAFFNVIRDTYNGGGSIVHEMDAQNLIENVYVQVKFTAYTGDFLGGFAGIGNGTFRNVIVHADFASKTSAYNGFCASRGENFSIENCYVISSNSNGFMYNGETEGVYKDAASFNKVVDQIEDSFSDECWQKINGTLFFASAKNITNAAYPSPSSISIDNNETTFDGTLIKINTSLTENVTIYLKQPYEGVQIKDGTLVSYDSFATGLLTVVAEWQHPIYGSLITTEKTFNVVAVQTIKIQTTQLIAKNRSGNFTFDLSEYNPKKIKSVEFNGKSIAYTLNEKTLSIEKSQFEAVTSILGVFVESDNARYIINIPIEAVDYAIGTAAELKSFGIGLKINLKAVAVLTSNVDYEGGNFFNDSGFNDSCFYSGVLDGKGYTVSNVKGTNGFFYGLKNATVKNIGFKNLVRDTYNGGGSLANEMLGNNFIENVYIDVKFTVYSGDYLAGVASICEGTFKNVVIIVDFQSNPGKYNAIGRSYNTAPSLEHCYAVSANSSGYMFGAVTEGLYTDEISFAAASINLINNFDLNFWTISGGKMTFKTAA